MHRIILLVTMIFLSMTSLVAGQDISLDEAFPNREAEFYIPSSYEAGDSLPLVFMLHGASGNGPNTREFVAFDGIAEELGMIAVYPSSLGATWDFGFNPQSLDEPSTDSAFLLGLIDFFAENYGIDTERVFIAGISDGGSMSYQMGCLYPQHFAAIGSVAAPMSNAFIETCSETPVSLMFIHGTHDPILTWEPAFRGGRMVGLGAENTVAFWGDHNGCEGTTEPQPIADSDPDDESTVFLLHIDDCAEDTEVLFYGVLNGGHTWPGRTFGDWTPPIDLGPINMDIDASQLLGEWFASYGAG